MYEHTVYEYAVKKVFSTHSFITHQISVVTLSDKEDGIFNGIAITPIPYSLFTEATYSEAVGDYGKPLVLDDSQALSLCQFIEEVLNGTLPSKISLDFNGLLLSIKLSKYNKNWHAGGAFKGKVVFGYSRPFDLFSKATITKQSLVVLKNSLMNLYKISSELVSNA